MFSFWEKKGEKEKKQFFVVVRESFWEDGCCPSGTEVECKNSRLC